MLKKNVSLNASIDNVPASPEIEENISLEKYITYLSTLKGEETIPMAEDSCPEAEITPPPPVLPVHTITIHHNPSAGSTFPVSGVGVVIPPKVAARMATGNFSVVLEPVQPTVERVPSLMQSKLFPHQRLHARSRRCKLLSPILLLNISLKYIFK